MYTQTLKWSRARTRPSMIIEATCRSFSRLVIGGSPRSIPLTDDVRQLFGAGAREDLAVLEFPRHEHAAGFAVLEGPKRYGDPHAGQKRGPCPTAASEKVWTHAFESPRLCLTRRILHIEPDPDMRVRPVNLL